MGRRQSPRPLRRRNLTRSATSVCWRPPWSCSWGPRGSLVVEGQPAIVAPRIWPIPPDRGLAHTSAFAEGEDVMKLLHEFREFAVKGNVIDLAVGVIIGAAFNKIVDSIVNDLVMPLISRIVGKLDFSSMFVVLTEPPPGTPMTLEALKKTGVPVFAWGNFVTVAVNFIILAFVIFLLVRQVNRVRRHYEHQPAPEAAPPAEDIVLLREIRDELRA